MAATGHYGSASIWRFDTKAIVGGVLLGIVMVLLVGISDKADASITGGAFLIFGGITWATVMGVSTLLCRQPGGMIAGLMEGVVAIMMGVSPLAPTFPIVNAAGSLAYSLVASKLPMTGYGHHLLAQIAANLVGNALISVGLFYILSLPVPIILLSSGVTALAGTIIGTILTKIIADSVNRAGVLD
jgi:hypothetical protein